MEFQNLQYKNNRKKNVVTENRRCAKQNKLYNADVFRYDNQVQIFISNLPTLGAHKIENRAIVQNILVHSCVTRKRTTVKGTYNKST